MNARYLQDAQGQQMPSNKYISHPAVVEIVHKGIEIGISSRYPL